MHTEKETKQKYENVMIKRKKIIGKWIHPSSVEDGDSKTKLQNNGFNYPSITTSHNRKQK